MEIIAHRGFFNGPQKPPAPDQLLQALALGFGIEFDVRDSAEGLILAHDPWEVNAQPFGQFLSKVPASGTLAINIKSCGLAVKMKAELEMYGISPARCFFFDMAIPDHLAYIKQGLAAYPRLSEIEPWGSLAQQAEGVWLDGFESTWWNASMVETWLGQGTKVCIVSPDLHRRERATCWQQLRTARLHHHQGLSLCTDYALEARDFFRT